MSDTLTEQTGIEPEMRQKIAQAIASGLAYYGNDNEHTFDVASFILADLKTEWQQRYPKRTQVPKKRKIPRSLANQVFERDMYRCVTCGDWHDLAADHIIPESRGGPLTLDNLQTLCRSCNSRKGPHSSGETI